MPRAKVASLVNEFEDDDIEIQTFTGLVKETARSREEMNEMCTNALDSDVPLKSLAMTRMEVAARTDQGVSFLSVRSMAKKPGEARCLVLLQKDIELDVLLGMGNRVEVTFGSVGINFIAFCALLNVKFEES